MAMPGSEKDIKAKWCRKSCESYEIQIMELPNGMPSLDQMKQFENDMKTISSDLKYKLKYGDNL